MKTFYIYVLIDPRTNAVRYVGCTMNPKSRLSAHMSNHSYPTKYKQEWINSMKQDGVKPIMQIIDSCTSREDAIVSEQKVFETYNDGNLLCVDPAKLRYNPSKRFSS